ncbi:hypothetical protein M5K25_003027 [Dendrobium thyrsiflorum]
MPTKDFVKHRTKKLHERMKTCIDGPLEAMARANEIYRCCAHFWYEFPDRLLCVSHREAMMEKENRTGDFLNAQGWKCVEKKFFEKYNHLVSQHFMQMRFHQLARVSKQEGTILPFIDRSSTDTDNVILYQPWRRTEDNFILNLFDELIKPRRGGTRRLFLNLQDWQDIQFEYMTVFGCCPTLTQLQARVRKLRSDSIK